MQQSVSNEAVGNRFKLVWGHNAVVGQALVRIFFSLICCAYAYLGWSKGWFGNPPPELFYTSVIFLALSSLHVLLVGFTSSDIWQYKASGMIFDISFATYCMIIGDISTIYLYGIYLWIVIGNGLRYGLKYLYIANVLSVIGFSIVITYGAADNLLKTPAGAPAPGRRKPMTAIDEEDLGYYRVMGELYREAIGLSKELESTSEPGTFSDWMYFHRGRLSLASRPWNPAIAVELSKPAEKDKNVKKEMSEDNEARNKGADSKKDKDKRNEKERQELNWFDKHAPEAFIPWQPIEHPDFPGQRVEVGGYAPFSLTNPPAGMLEEILGKHTDFLTTVAQRLGRISIRKVETQHLGQSIYDIEIQVENTGFLPTSLAQGQTTREIYPTRLVLELDDEFFLSGARITSLPTLPGSGGMVEARYIIYAPGRKKIDFTIVSMLAGKVEGTIDLVKSK